MDSSRPSLGKLLTLQEAASVLAVSIDVLLRWNEHQILKPTITQTGQIGYTQEQIDQFVRIQESLRIAKSQPSRFIDSSPQETTRPSPLANHRPSLLFFSSIGVISIVLAGVILTQQGQINALLTQYEESTSQPHVLGAQSSSPQLVLPVASALPLTKNSQDTTSALSTKAPNRLFASQQKTTPVSTHTSQPPIASVAAAMTSQHAPLPQEANSTSTFADTQAAQANTNSNSLFDKSGNITGAKSAQTDVLAMNIGTGLTTPDAGNPTSPDTHSQLILFIMTISGLGIFLLRKSKKTIPAAQLNHSTLPPQKFLEIDQKMDGTIMLSIQGKDYKISKPELHSDSDRFFERLMEVVGHGVKEIEYDNYNDDKMRLSTPLSRLVTRLGFVGIKRDLFFPRTSKHNVLFRKYITHEDLEAMHVSSDQVIKDLLQTFQPN